jgi:hypothetical protein
MHRRCVEVSSALPTPVVGSLFRVEDQQLRIDSGLAFDIDNALLWSEPSLDSKEALDLSELPARIRSFFSSLDFLQARGFGQFIPQILSLIQSSSASLPIETTDPILRAAQPLVLDMARACLEGNTSRISQNADALIGLGSGLTPSGDDFLGGLLFAIKILQIAYPESNLIHPSIAVESYSSRTHLISFTLLQDHANGHSVESLHQIINGLLSRGSLKSIYLSFSQLIQVGHSTGWDLLTGLLVGLLAANGVQSLPTLDD